MEVGNNIKHRFWAKKKRDVFDHGGNLSSTKIILTRAAHVVSIMASLPLCSKESRFYASIKNGGDRSIRNVINVKYSSTLHQSSLT